MGTTLFTIPVYPCSEEVFEEKWDSHLRQQINEKSDPNALLPLLRQSSEPASVWKLNRVIGYIVVEVARRDIFVRVYKMNRQQLGAIRMSRGTIKDLWNNGSHFRHIGMRNEAIAKKLNELVLSIADTFFRGKYPDMEGFLVSCDFIDYVGLAAVSPCH